MQLFAELKNLSNKHIKANKKANDQVPTGLWLACPKCKKAVYHKDLGLYQSCPYCQYGFRIGAYERLAWLVDEFEELDTTLTTKDPLNFPNYQAKLAQAKKQTKLNDAVLTALAKINGQKCALAIMDPNFIMGSLGSVTGEKITNLFEKALHEKLPVVIFCASGGARMQEGIFSLMQMAKISQAIKRHQEAGLFYLSILTDPTTGGVSASFAMQGDIILAEPKTLVGFAGRRVIEQTTNQKIPLDLQDATNVLQNGFIDAIVPRTKQKETISWLLKMHTTKVVTKWSAY